jgi:1-acyl-sn-glycerol-3-phosphate acyltransferase
VTPALQGHPAPPRQQTRPIAPLRRLRVQRLAWRAFEMVFTPWRRRHLAGIHLAGLPRDLPPGLPLILVANHVSWWDGFLLREVQRELRPGRPLITVMREDSLAHNPVLRWLGAMPLVPGSVASLRALLHDLHSARAAYPAMVVLFFPQGKIGSSRRRPLGFRRGIERIVARLSPCIVLPVALHLEPLTQASPAAFVHAGDPIVVHERVALNVIEEGVTHALDRLTDMIDVLGEDILLHWPTPREPLPQPSAAVIADARAGAD